MIGVAFTLGMAAVFFVVGLFLSDIGVFIRQARFFDLAAGLLMIFLGVNIIKPIGEKYISAGKWVTKVFGLAVIVIGLIYATRYFGFKLW